MIESEDLEKLLWKQGISVDSMFSGNINNANI
jgi:hypothetical protein